MLPRSAAVANLLPVQPLPQAAMTELHSGLATDVVAIGLGANLGTREARWHGPSGLSQPCLERSCLRCHRSTAPGLWIHRGRTI